MLGSSWVAAQLAASQEGLSSMSEWVRLSTLCRTACCDVLESKNIWKLRGRRQQNYCVSVLQDKERQLLETLLPHNLQNYLTKHIISVQFVNVIIFCLTSFVQRPFWFRKKDPWFLNEIFMKFWWDETLILCSNKYSAFTNHFQINCHFFHSSTSLKKVLVLKPEGKELLGRPKSRRDYSIEMDLREIWWDGIDKTDLAQNRDQ
jgi:hypothetical protein